MVERLHLVAGDHILALETEKGILLTPYDLTVGRALEIASRAAKKHRSRLAKLAT